MPVEDFIIYVYCLVDDFYQREITTPLRTRGRAPKLTDSEVITMEIVGEWTGHHTDKGIWEYFKGYWLPLFPDLPARSQFARQASNLSKVKQLFHQYLCHQLRADTCDVHLIDGFPIEFCKLTRVRKCKSFKGYASYGYCASKDMKYYGFHGHLLVDERGIPVELTLTAANVDERDAAYEIINNIKGLLIGDKGLIRPILNNDCSEADIDLQTPLRKNMKDNRPKWAVKQLMNVRRRVETTIGQLVKYFDIEHVNCRDLWHLTSRMGRKVLSLTIGAYFNIEFGRDAMKFEEMLAI